MRAMSLPKKTVRTEVPDEIHRGLRVLVDLSRFGTLERYVEALIARHVVSEAKAAIVRADEFQRAGIDRTFRESQFDWGADK
jgi:hypothetical protein